VTVLDQLIETVPEHLPEFVRTASLRCRCGLCHALRSCRHSSGIYDANAAAPAHVATARLSNAWQRTTFQIEQKAFILKRLSSRDCPGEDDRSFIFSRQEWEWMKVTARLPSTI
jgi:hypothetical protein